MTRLMKDSGVEWIGKIPLDWEVGKFNRVLSKKKVICNHYNNEKILSLTMKGVVVRDLNNPQGKMPATFDGYQKVEKGNLLLCLFDIDVTPRCVGIIRNDGLTSPAYSQYVLKDKSSLSYYYYLLLALDNDKVLVHMTKSLRHTLKDNDFRNLFTIIPPLFEQQKIADFLDEKIAYIDSIIRDTKQSIEDLKKYKQAIITETVTKGLDSNVNMKNSGIEWIGEIPDSWNISKLSRLVKKIGDVDHRMPEGKSEGIPYVSPLNFVGENEIDFDSAKKISQDDYIDLSKKIKPEPGDIIFARYATIGTVRIVAEKRDFLASYSCLIIKTNEKIKSDFLYYYLKSKVVFGEVEYRKKSNTQSNIGLEDLKQFKVPVPSLKTQENIVSFLNKKVNEINTIVRQKEQLIKEFETYKKSLIYEYVTGKKEVL